MLSTTKHRGMVWLSSAFLVALAILFSITSCSPSEQNVLGTEVARAKDTAVAEAGKVAKTKAAEVRATAPVIVGTQAAGIAGTAHAKVVTEAAGAAATAKARVATEAARLLTPKAPGTPEAPVGNAVVTYTVVEGDTLTEIAHQFSLDVNALVQLNRDRYPSLQRDPNHVEIGWVLIVATGPEVTSTPPPPAPTTLPSSPVCDESSVYWAQGFKCEEYQLDAVTKIGLNVGCIVFRRNPLGYYKEHTVYTGWVLTRNGYTISYGWYADRELNKTVIGPAIVKEKHTYVECGIPRNP